MTKKALITGITGQDGSYLAELLLAKGYEVHGIVRRSSSFNTARIDHLFQDPHVENARLILHYGDMTDSGRLAQLCYEVRPDEIYNLAAQSHVRISFDMPEYSGDVDALGAIRLLEAVRQSGIGRDVRFYQASTSELFGKVEETPQRETTPFHPRSPYAVAKLYAYWAVKNYREAYGLFASNGIPRTSSTSATSTLGATGGLPATSLRGCGASSSTTGRTTSCSPPARPTPCASSSRRRSADSGLTGASTLSTIRRWSARWTPSRSPAIRPRPGASWAGSLRSSSPTWSQ